jgi:Fe2+ or Zn2+ uptake regulation protein
MKWGRYVDNETTNIAKEILQYLSEHPEAQDTIEGISSWWFNSTNMNIEKTEVIKSLDYLVTKGIIVVVAKKDGNLLYSLNINHRKK